MAKDGTNRGGARPGAGRKRCGLPRSGGSGQGHQLCLPAGGYFPVYGKPVHAGQKQLNIKKGVALVTPFICGIII